MGSLMPSGETGKQAIPGLRIGTSLHFSFRVFIDYLLIRMLNQTQ